jgi:serine/threonine protein phosphatase 1
MNTQPLPPVRALPSNRLGRDFVVGDLHGCFDLLDRLLDFVRFDPGCDRLFSVGDLVDRGPDSLRSLEFLESPWFHAVRGNHEAMLLDYFGAYLASGSLDDWQDVCRSDMWLNGGEWVAAAFVEDGLRMMPSFDRLLESLQELPLMWVVGQGEERFHVLHAELVRPDYRKNRQKVWLDADIDRWLAGEAIDEVTLERLMWGRTLMLMLASPFVSPEQQGLSTTFCGHTIDDSVRSYLSHVCLDTGAYRSLDVEGFGLTLHGIHEQRQLRATYGSPGVVETRFALRPGLDDVRAVHQRSRL